jgi:alkylation response protein AidB-like acyl-CoA dehydrogenase
MVRDYCLRRVRPEAPQRERIEDPDQRFPWDWVEDLSRMGLRTMVLPPELGGWGADTLACCVLAEELAAGDMGLAVIFDQTWKNRLRPGAERRRRAHASPWSRDPFATGIEWRRDTGRSNARAADRHRDCARC